MTTLIDRPVTDEVTATEPTNHRYGLYTAIFGGASMPFAALAGWNFDHGDVPNAALSGAAGLIGLCLAVWQAELNRRSERVSAGQEAR